MLNMHNAYLTKRLRFLKDPLDVRTCDMSGESSIVFFGVPWDGAVAGRPGARYAPAHIRTALCSLPKRFDLEDMGDIDVVIGDAEETWKRIKETAKALNNRRQLLIAGGDHSVSAFTYQGLAEGRRLGYIVLDAHLDLRTTSEGLTSGLTTRLIREYAKEAPITVIGVRPWANPQYMFNLAEKLDVDYYTIDNLEKLGLDEVVDRVVSRHKDVQNYISIDLDVVDPAFAPGVNAPRPGGLSAREAIKLVAGLSKALRPIAVDTVEVSPPYDVGNVTSNLAAVLLYVSVWQ